MVKWLPHDVVLRLLAQDEIYLIDIRSAPHYCHGHPLGALCVPLSQQGFAERVATATEAPRPVVLLSASDFEIGLAEPQLDKNGWTCLGGVDGDRSLWTDAGATWSKIPEIPIGALNGMGKATDIVVLDVREALEWETGYVPGATLISLGNLRQALDRLSRKSEITVICEAGLRSATAASILQASGFSNVSHLPEGTAGYRRSGRSLEFSAIEQESFE